MHTIKNALKFSGYENMSFIIIKQIIQTYFDYSNLFFFFKTLNLSGYENMSEKMDQFPVGNLDNKVEVMIKMKFRRQ